MPVSASAAWRWLRRPVRLGIGLAISAVFLVLAVRQVDWGKTAAALLAANLPLIGLGAILLVGTFVLFAVRWRVLLQGAARLSVKDTFAYIMIGYLANTVLPLRLGDVARAALLGLRRGLSTSLVLGSVVLERVLDLLTMLALALGLSLAVDIPPAVRAGMATLAGVTLAALVVLFLLARSAARLPGLEQRLPTWIPRALSGRLLGLATRFAGGLRALRSGWQIGAALLLSGLAWAVAGAGTICWVTALHLPAPWYAGLFVLAVINLGAAIPSSPGAIGVYHYLAVLALSVWVEDKSIALGYAVATHGLNIILNVLLGLIAMGWENIAFSQLRRAPQQLDGEQPQQAPPAGGLPLDQVRAPRPGTGLEGSNHPPRAHLERPADGSAEEYP